jgi:hypothetical protein
VLGVVKSRPFQMNTVVEPVTSTASAETTTVTKGVN